MNHFFHTLSNKIGAETLWLCGFLILVVLGFQSLTPTFLSTANLFSIAFQLPELGLLTLAMLIPITSGGFNLAIIAIANVSGLTLASFLAMNGGVDASVASFLIGIVLAIIVGALCGTLIGVVVSFLDVHPILASLAAMIFLRGIGEFITRGADISGFPTFVATIGHGSFLGVPIPLIIFIVAAFLWSLLLSHSRHGFTARMIGSNIVAATWSGLNTKRNLVLIYTLSGVMCSLAGILMLTRFNSVRIGHGDALLLITVLACFLGGVAPFGGFGRVLPVVIALISLQSLSSGLNLIGANQHLATAIWGLFLILVMISRSVGSNLALGYFKFRSRND
ncbi:ABC transporter permease [Bartonella sp. HY329]|uniref:ABC transporter permease n=1 Tax=unclassified Bartonella TaxID=2645622 RepID=UPI0021CA1258|nr:MULTISPECIES: ABC transporter permease [unclassified Bartonella]UXM94034.1 ABC transporter permease [Bartonella sp. HY329]UXN08356.1 ABC transporter permease [Bartonella sp. HY328]